MSGRIDVRLNELGLELPPAHQPVANYVGFVRTGNLLICSGQICIDADGKLIAKGKLGKDVAGRDEAELRRAVAFLELAR